MEVGRLGGTWAVRQGGEALLAAVVVAGGGRSWGRGVGLDELVRRWLAGWAATAVVVTGGCVRADKLAEGGAGRW